MARHNLTPGRPISAATAPAGIHRTVPAIGGGAQGAVGPPGPPGRDGAGAAAANVVAYGASPDGSVDATSAFNAALAFQYVTVPAGTYRIAGAVASSVANQHVQIEPGASLIIADTGSVSLTGARLRLRGLNFTITAASSATWIAVDIGGAESVIDDLHMSVTDDVPNCTLMRLSGDAIRVRDASLLGTGKAFKYAIKAIASNDTDTTDGSEIDGFNVDVGDDGANVTLGALIYWRSIRGEIAKLKINSGTRQLFPNGVVVQDARHLTLRKCKIFAAGATFAVKRLTDSEFCEVYGGHFQGRNNTTYQANSRAISCDSAAGHLKLYNASLTGWIHGVEILGTHDTFTAHGTTIVNNRDYALVVDTGGPGARGISFHGCYLADAYGVGMIHLKSGLSEGVSIHGCEIGYQEIGIYVEDAFGTLSGVKIGGNEVQGGLEGATPIGFIRPGLNTDDRGIEVGINTYQSAGTIATGAYASKVVDEANPRLGDVVADTIEAVESLQIGATGNPILKRFFTYFTANFASGIGANSAVELDFSWSDGGVATQKLTGGIAGAIAANTSLSVDDVYVKSPGTVTLRMRNNTGTPVGAISGTVFFESTKEVL